MTIANPYVQFLSKRRGCNTNGCKCRKNESNLAHFYTPGLLVPECNALTKLLFRRTGKPRMFAGRWICKVDAVGMLEVAGIASPGNGKQQICPASVAS
jgi:hypothetical protein